MQEQAQWLWCLFLEGSYFHRSTLITSSNCLPKPVSNWHHIGSQGFNLWICMCVYAQLLQLCPTLCNSMDCSPPGSSVHGILQAIKLEWIAMHSSRVSSGPRDQPVSLLSPALAGRFFTTSATWEHEYKCLIGPHPQFIEGYFQESIKIRETWYSCVKLNWSHHNARDSVSLCLQAGFPWHSAHGNRWGKPRNQGEPWQNLPGAPLRVRTSDTAKTWSRMQREYSTILCPEKVSLMCEEDRKISSYFKGPDRIWFLFLLK